MGHTTTIGLFDLLTLLEMRTFLILGVAILLCAAGQKVKPHPGVEEIYLGLEAAEYDTHLEGGSRFTGLEAAAEEIYLGLEAAEYDTHLEAAEYDTHLEAAEYDTHL